MECFDCCACHITHTGKACLSAAWKTAQEAAEAARKVEHDRWAEAKRLGQEADEATAERLTVMRERVTELKGEMKTVKEEVTASSSSVSSTTTKVAEESSGDDQVHVSLKGKGSQGVKVKVAAEE